MNTNRRSFLAVVLGAFSAPFLKLKASPAPLKRKLPLSLDEDIGQWQSAVLKRGGSGSTLMGLCSKLSEDTTQRYNWFKK